MSLSGLSLTNQRLYFAKLQLRQYASFITAEAEPVMQAQYESVLFHLTLSYQAFLFELVGVDSQGLAVSDAVSASALIEASESDLISPELRELALQENESAGWLASLQAAYRQIGMLESDDGMFGAVQHSEISVTMLAANEDKLSELTLWHQSLASTVQRLRAVSQEW